VNYFKHHIGDYDSATAHLSWDEDMAYTRLIRLYYRREAPLPPDLSQICRLIRAGKREAPHVQAVLEEFFTLSEDGWHNKRCDEEILDSRAKAERNREVGKKGGRPKKKETQMVSENNPDDFQEETQMVSENNPSHKPIANSHIPTSSSQARARDGAFPIMASWEPEEAFWTLAKRSGHTPDSQDYANALTDFIAYWLTNPGESRTQSQWEKSFLASWKSYRSHASAAERPSKPHGANPPRLSPHHDFEKRDYSVGINEDGSF